jgi:Thioredoxin
MKLIYKNILHRKKGVFPMNLNEWFEKGMTFDQYVNGMKVNKEEMMSIYDRFELDEDDKGALESVKNLNLRMIALTEDWCGDAMLNNPIMMKIAEEANIEVRFLLRDQNLELMDQYLTNGTARAIPKYIFIDQNGNEVAVWGPRAPRIQQFVMDQREKLPSQDSPDFQEKQKEMYKGITEQFIKNEDFWNDVAYNIIDLLHNLENK